ncbi:hypothetical protein QQP08_027031 [Theobroma cacao]|nr:hypothetical protein QQP08_027031 [Theobroma cacao]
MDASFCVSDCAHWKDRRFTIQVPNREGLFQEERPVWHTINCNVLPKDYKDSKVEDAHITMIMDSEDQSSYDSRE